MTAPAIGSTSTNSTSSKSAPNTPTPASTAGFAHQLHAARQHDDPAAQAPAAARQASPARGPGDTRGNNPEPSGSGSRHADAGANRPDKNRDPAVARGDASSKAGAKAQASAEAPTPATASTAAPLAAEAVADIAPGDAAPDEKDTDTDDSGQSAAALVGAMLALVGPAAGKLLTLGAPGSDVASGKPVSADAGAAALLQGGGTASMPVTASAAASVMPAPWFAVANLPLGQKDMRDGAGADAAPSLVLSAATLAAPALPVSPPTLVPAGAQAFAQELGQQVTWFVDQGIKQARIRLHPEELGSLDLKISVNHGRVDVVFHAQHPGAVAAVQQSLPQLDQMLAQHGLSLGNTEVGQHDRGDQSGHAGRGDRTSEIDEIHGSSVVTPLSQLGLLDAFA